MTFLNDLIDTFCEMNPLTADGGAALVAGNSVGAGCSWSHLYLARDIHCTKAGHLLHQNWILTTQKKDIGHTKLDIYYTKSGYLQHQNCSITDTSKRCSKFR